MQVEPIDGRTPRSRRQVDSFSHLRLSGVRALAQVLAQLQALRQAQPGVRFVCTLDDLDQCCYTSMHAGEDERIALDVGDVDHDDPAAVHAAQARTLAHVVAQLEHSDHRLAWEQVGGALALLPDDVQALLAANLAPDAIVDDVVYVQRLPVARDDLLIAGLPNGYFRADLDVFQNHAVIRHLQAAYGYRLFGIGASWLGFVRDAAPAAGDAARLVADLRRLYGACAHDDAPWLRLHEALCGRTTLLLGYTENFADTLAA